MESGEFCENSASFPVMCYLKDFIDRACTIINFIRRTKVIPSFFKEEIELIISKIAKFLFRSVIFHSIFWKYNSLILGYFSGVYYLTIAGAFRFSFLDPIRVHLEEKEDYKNYLRITPSCQERYYTRNYKYERRKHTKTKVICKNISCSFIFGFIFLYFCSDEVI